MSEKLEIIISATDKGATKVIKKITVNTKDLGDATEKTAKQTKKAAKSNKDLVKSFKGMATGLMTAVGGIAAAGFALKKAFDFAKEGASMMRLEEAGESLAQSFGTSMDVIVDAVKDASFGTISNMDIIAAANKAMLLGVAHDAETMSDLMQVAMSRGRAMGLSTKQAFSDIVVGIGRASPMILDNLGIVLDAEKVYGDYAESIGKAAGALTKAEKIQALTQSTIKEGNKLIEDSGGIYQDAAGEIEAMEAEFANLGATLKKAVLPPFLAIARAINDTAQGTRDHMDVLYELHEAREAGAISTLEYLTLEAELTEGIIKNVEVLEILTQAEFNQNMARGYAVMAMSEEERALWELATANTQYKEISEESTIATEDLGDSMVGGASSAGALANSLFNASTAIVGYDASIRAAASAGELLAGANRNIGSSISGLRKDIDWLAGGGMELQLQFEQVKAAVLANAITPEEAKGMLDNLFVQAQAIEIDMGEIDFKTAATNIADELDIPLDAAETALSDLQGGIDDLDITGLFKDALAPSAELQGNTKLLSDDLAAITDTQVDAFMEGWGSAMTTDVLPPLNEAVIGVGELNTELGLLPAEKTVTIYVNYVTTGESPQEYQHGGHVPGDAPIIVGEAGPELFVPKGAGDIIPNNMLDTGVTNNYYYLTINDAGARGDVITDFTLMKALASV